MKKLIALFTLAFALQVHAHGEDKPGPHGGFISMPSVFHVELVPAGKNELKVYLLDMEWKNPTVEDSSVAITHGSIAASCKTKSDHFVCAFAKTVDLTKAGEISVSATRKKQVGATLKHALPLARKAH